MATFVKLQGASLDGAIVADFVLAVLLKANYAILSFWMNGWSIVPCAITEYLAYEEDELWGRVSIAEILVAIGIIIATAFLV